MANARILWHTVISTVAAENLNMHYCELQREFERVRGQEHQPLEPVEDDGWVMEGWKETDFEVTFEEESCSEVLLNETRHGIASY